MTDQPTAGVALKLIQDIAANAIRCHDTEKPFDPSIFLHRLSTLRTPASGPVEADDRLAVAVEALERIASYKWPVIVGHTTTTSIGQATGEVYESKWPVPKEGVLGALESVKTIAAQTLALLTSGEQPVTDPYKLDGGEAGE